MCRHTYAYTYVYMYIYIYIERERGREILCMYLCLYVCMYVYICVYIYICKLEEGERRSRDGRSFCMRNLLDWLRLGWLKSV